MTTFASAMNKNRHILFLCRWYPNRYDPMFGLFVKRHAEAAAVYNKVSVVYAHAADNLNSPFEIDQSVQNGVNTVIVYFRKRNFKPVSILNYLRAIKKGLKKVERPNVIHVNILTRLGIVALWYKIFRNTPYIITEHWSRYLPGNDYKGCLRKLATKTVVKHASIVSVVTDNLAQAMQNHGLNNKNYRIIPNIVDTNQFVPIEHTNEIPSFVHVSCFENKSKNISGLLDSLNALYKKGVQFRCTLVGDGMDFEAMKSYCNKLGLNEVVSFTGLLEGKELSQTIARHDFLVVSSNYENLPVVIPEAMACGLPVVSTNVGGIREIVDNECGILVEPFNVQALADAIEQMIYNYQSYDSTVIRQKVVSRNSTESVGTLLTDWYNEILSH